MKSRMNQADIENFLLKTTKLTRIFLLSSIFIFSIGLMALSKIENYNSKISAFAIDNPDSYENPNKVSLGILYTILLISLLGNMLFFLYVKRILNTLSEVGKRVEKGVNSIQERKNDEIKEVVITRNVLLDKLVNKKS